MTSPASVGVRVDDPSYQAYQILHLAYVVAPIVAGVDKFFHFLVNWDQYLSPMMSRVPVSTHTFMLGVGVVEIVAGLLVAVKPMVGALVVGFWFCGIILNLLSIPAYLDIALRDLGLALGAVALARLAAAFEGRP